MTRIIWTNHALERNKERKITTSWVEKTVRDADSVANMEEGKIKSIKNFGKQTVSVVTAKTDSGENLILSAWIDPPNYGTTDYNKKSGLKNFWVTLKNQIGL